MSTNLTLMNIMMIMEGRNFLKCTLIGLFTLGLVSSCWSQAGDKGVMFTEIGVGAAGYKLTTNYSFEESVGIESGLIALVGYNFHKNVAFKVEVENRNYVGGDSVEVDKIVATRAGLGLEFHAVNKKHFLLSFGMTVGGFGFNYNVMDSTNAIDIKANGIYQKIGISSRFYFGEKSKFGLFLNAGFINNPMTYRSFEFNNENRKYIAGNLVSDYKVLSRGLYANIGLTFNWRIKKYY